MRKLWKLIEQSVSDARRAEALDLRGNFRRAVSRDRDAALARFAATRG